MAMFKKTIGQCSLDIEVAKDVLYELQYKMDFSSTEERIQYITEQKAHIKALEQELFFAKDSFSIPASESTKHHAKSLFATPLFIVPPIAYSAHSTPRRNDLHYRYGNYSSSMIGSERTTNTMPALFHYKYKQVA